MEIRVLNAEGFHASRDVRSRSFGTVSDDDWAETRRFVEPSLAGGRQYGGYEDGLLEGHAPVLDTVFAATPFALDEF